MLFRMNSAATETACIAMSDEDHARIFRLASRRSTALMDRSMPTLVAPQKISIDALAVKLLSPRI